MSCIWQATQHVASNSACCSVLPGWQLRVHGRLQLSAISYLCISGLQALYQPVYLPVQHTFRFHLKLYLEEADALTGVPVSRRTTTLGRRHA